jgi:2-polyprenyl-3-methyl-5-hydroxy-6-metoxy-1,4-benzoquinol methylase
MGIRRVALIYDSQTRPETTGEYCRRALQELVDVQHFLPNHFDRVPRNDIDLYLNIDDGLHYQLPADLHPSAWWAIDTHMDFAWCLTKAHDFDCLFAAQRDGAAQLRIEGISTTWLPLACEPTVHRPHPVEKRWDACFVGHVFPGPRADLLELLKRHFPNTFVGQRYFDEMAQTYSASRVVFNRSIRNDVNMRVFEALACGSLLMTNDLSANGQADLFQDGKHLATYTDVEELLYKVTYYLAHDTMRERIAAAGRQEVLARHTYRLRMETLLAEVEKQLSRTTLPIRPPAKHPAPPAAVPRENETPGLPVSSQEQPVCDPFYFDWARPEILALIPTTAARVLDVGCGAGRLGEALKARQHAEVIGIELVEAAAKAAQGRLDDVLVGDVERMSFSFAAGSFDGIVCGDVLEHLRDPAHFLGKARTWLRPQGILIASIPNVRHHTVIRGLLAGNWTYEAAGLLDRTHLRFFTRRTIEQLCYQAGYEIRALAAVPGPGYQEWQERGRPGEVHAGTLHLADISPTEAEEFYVYQYLVTAVPALDADEPTIVAPARDTSKPTRALRIMYLGDFGSSWRHEKLAADALEVLGHSVYRHHEYAMESVERVVEELNSGRYDCLLFYKGRIGTHSLAQRLAPSGEPIAAVLAQAKVPCYTWYVDRAYQFDFDPSREAWMRRVAPLCRVAFVADAPLAQTDWARWHILREPICARDVRTVTVPEGQRQDVAIIGQVYGTRDQELAPVAAAFPLQLISGVYGAELSPVLRQYRVILGPRYPCVPGYWGNRLYVVLGHGGFFLAPEVEGMREEGFQPEVHYAPLGDDPVASIRYWLKRPEERDRIAQAGQEFVLNRFTYDVQVRELCRVIEETL